MAMMRYQPQGRARLDQRNPLAQGLVFASIAGGPDLISGTMPVKMGAGTTSVFEQGKTLYTPGTTSDGWYWPLPPNHPLYTIGAQDTIFVLAKRINGSSFNNLLGVPYRNGAWSSPYYAWGISGQSDNTMGAYTVSTSSTNRNSVTTGSSGYFVNGVTTAIGGTRNGTRVRFYTGATQFIADQAIAAGSPDWTNKQPLVLFNRSNTAAGEGMSAHAGLVLVWNRELTPAEWASVSQNPWQLFLDLSEEDDLLVASAGGGTPTTLSPAGVSLALTGGAPSIVQPSTLAPSGASLALTGYAPGLSQAVSLSPGTASLALAGYAPDITQASGLYPSGASLTLTGYAPAINQPQNLSPPGVGLALAGYAPTVAQAVPVTLAPSGAVLALSAYTPMVMQGAIPQEQATSGGGGAYGGSGSVREVRAFADLLERKPSRSQKKARRRQLEAEALELLPDLPEAEKLAPIAARIVYEQEARALAPLYANRPARAMQPVIQPFDTHAALVELIDKLLAEALLQQKVAEDEENDVELLLFGT